MDCSGRGSARKSVVKERGYGNGISERVMSSSLGREMCRGRERIGKEGTVQDTASRSLLEDREKWDEIITFLGEMVGGEGEGHLLASEGMGKWVGMSHPLMKEGVVKGHKGGGPFSLY